jgi:hypothetical protein
MHISVLSLVIVEGLVKYSIEGLENDDGLKFNGHEKHQQPSTVGVHKN